MQSFFHQLAQLTDAWSAPPDPRDAVWLHEFESANIKQKEQIANSWLWGLNTHWRIHQQGNDSLRWISPQYKLYAKIAPYINQVNFENQQLKGKFEDFFELNSIKQWHSITEKQRDQFLADVKTAWFDSNGNKLKACQRILRLIDGADYDVHNQLKRYYPLLFSITWDKAMDTEGKLQRNWVDVASKLSVLCGLNASGIETVPDKWNDREQGKALFLLGYSIKHRNMMATKVEKIPDLTKAIHSLPKEIGLACIIMLLGRATEVKTPEVHWLSERTYFNPTTSPSVDYYAQLRLWLPAYDDLWNTCEALGVFYEDALKQAAQEKTVQHDVCIPNNLSDSIENNIEP